MKKLCVIGSLVMSLHAAAPLNAQDSVVTSAKLIVAIQPKLAAQSERIAGAFKKVAVTVETDDTVAAAVKRWEETLEAALRENLEASDKETLALLAVDDADRHVRLIQAAAQTRTNVVLALKKAFDARRNDLSKVNKSDIKAELEKATADIAGNEIAKALAAREVALLTAVTESNAPTVQRALDARAVANEKAFLEQFSKQTGISKVVRCLASGFDTQTPSLTCHPDGLVLGGMSTAHVRISGLPVNRAVTVRAQLTEAGEQVACGTATDEACDSVQLVDRGSLATGTRDATVIVHTERRFAPTYHRSGDKTLQESVARLRSGERERPLQLIARGIGSELGIELEVAGLAPLVKAEAIPVAFERWRFETGTMFAVSSVVDDRIVTRPSATPGRVEVVDRRSVDSIRPETVLFLNLVPANYEIFGIGFGLHTSSDRNVSYYLGGSVRLLSLGERALASFSAGLSGAQARRFPGLRFRGSTLTRDATDPVLQGALIYETGFYVGISLGFRFGSLGSDTEPGNQ